MLDKGTISTDVLGPFMGFLVSVVSSLPEADAQECRPLGPGRVLTLVHPPPPPQNPCLPPPVMAGPPLPLFIWQEFPSLRLLRPLHTPPVISKAARLGS